jgi:hypothetical protein
MSVVKTATHARTQFDDVVLRQKNVLRLQIAMQNVPIVDTLERKTQLNKPLDYLLQHEKH